MHIRLLISGAPPAEINPVQWFCSWDLKWIWSKPGPPATRAKHKSNQSNHYTAARFGRGSTHLELPDCQQIHASTTAVAVAAPRSYPERSKTASMPTGEISSADSPLPYAATRTQSSLVSEAARASQASNGVMPFATNTRRRVHGPSHGNLNPPCWAKHLPQVASMHGAHLNGRPGGLTIGSRPQGLWMISTAEVHRRTAPLASPFVWSRTTSAWKSAKAADERTACAVCVATPSCGITSHTSKQRFKTKTKSATFGSLSQNVADTSFNKMIHVHPSLPNSTHVYSRGSRTKPSFANVTRTGDNPS